MILLKPEFKAHHRFLSGLLLTMLLLSGCYGTIHVKEKAEPKPAPDTLSIERGRRLYQDHCQACHGETGRGDGPEADRFDPRPVDLLQSGLHITTTGLETIVDYPYYSADALCRRIRHGSADMPEFKATFSEAEIQDLVQHLQQLRPTEEKRSAR